MERLTRTFPQQLAAGVVRKHVEIFYKIGKALRSVWAAARNQLESKEIYGCEYEEEYIESLGCNHDKIASARRKTSELVE